MKLENCPSCGVILTKPRSLPDHRRLFGIIQAAFSNWPHAHPFQPSCPEHLRAFLLVESGYADSTPIFVEADCFPEQERSKALQLVRLAVEASVAAALGQGDYAFVRVVGDTISVFRPRSIAFANLGQREFGPIREAIENVIEGALGVTCHQLLTEKAA